VRRLLEPLGDRVRLGCGVHSVRRQAGHVDVQPVRGAVERFDRVVLAVHADQALAMLSDATDQEREILSAFPYQENDAVLHTDVSVLPQRRRAWASWNYHLAASESPAATVTYDLSRLQRLPVRKPLLLTLNRSHAIAPQTMVRRFAFAHPAYTQASIAAQRRFDEINNVRRTYFCGAYWGYGFHEDGVNSALAVARYFGKDLGSCTAASTPGASCTPATGR
jgi:predicted NAD/FAD-binding protein